MSDESGDLLARAPAVHALVTAAQAAGLALDGVWLVGGAVRDVLLGVGGEIRDIDFAVEGDGPAFARLLTGAVGGEVTSEHDFGTARAVVDLGAQLGTVRIDVASCRTETYAEPGALPAVTAGASIDDDLVRRDVTINAIALSLTADDAGEYDVRDPHGGIADLSARVVRVLHDESLRDDPTRIFRVARYAGRLGFRVDDHTRRLIVDAVAGGAIQTLSADRLRTELILILREPAWESLTLLAAWGVFEQLDPRLDGVFSAPYLLRSIDQACGTDVELHKRVAALRLAALVRPLGDDALGWLRWIEFSSDVVTRVEDLLRLVGMVLDRPDDLCRLPNSELYIELGEVSDDAFALAALAVTDDDIALHTRLDDYRDALRSVDLTVRGEDVMAAGVPAGPEVGRILGTIFLRSLDRDLQGEDDERRALTELAREYGGADQ